MLRPCFCSLSIALRCLVPVFLAATQLLPLIVMELERSQEVAGWHPRNVRDAAANAPCARMLKLTRCELSAAIRASDRRHQMMRLSLRGRVITGCRAPPWDFGQRLVCNRPLRLSPRFTSVTLRVQTAVCYPGFIVDGQTTSQDDGSAIPGSTRLQRSHQVPGLVQGLRDLKKLDLDSRKSSNLGDSTEETTKQKLWTDGTSRTTDISVNKSGQAIGPVSPAGARVQAISREGRSRGTSRNFPYCKLMM